MSQNTTEQLGFFFEDPDAQALAVEIARISPVDTAALHRLAENPTVRKDPQMGYVAVHAVGRVVFPQ